MRLVYELLPSAIKESYLSKDIYKIVKQSSTIINIHLKTRVKETWKKSGSTWYKIESDK